MWITDLLNEWMRHGSPFLCFRQNMINVKNQDLTPKGLTRESPSFRLIELLEEKDAVVDYNDPYLPKAPKMRKHKVEKASVELTAESLARYDCVLIATDHSDYDARFIVDNARLVVDTRNLTGKNMAQSSKVVKA
jgi:UDP-N-acetyl-D-glucosamine dehydrogenase